MLCRARPRVCSGDGHTLILQLLGLRLDNTPDPRAWRQLRNHAKYAPNATAALFESKQRQGERSNSLGRRERRELSELAHVPQSPLVSSTSGFTASLPPRSETRLEMLDTMQSTLVPSQVPPLPAIPDIGDDTVDPSRTSISSTSSSSPSHMDRTSLEEITTQLTPLLDRIRDAHNRSLANPIPTPRLISRIASQDYQQSSDDRSDQIPPTYLPPISFLPEPKRRNPYIINALFLQAIFLGASALGLIRGRKQIAEETAVTLREKEKQVAAVKKELSTLESSDADRRALNLVISSWAMCAQETSVEASSSSRQFTKSEAVRPIKALLQEFHTSRLAVDRFTILSVLAFVAPSLMSGVKTNRSGPTPKATPYTSIRPELLNWAWHEFTLLQEPRSTEENALNQGLVDTFLALTFDPQHDLAQQGQLKTEIVEKLANLGLLSTLSTTMQQLLVKSAISNQLWSIPALLLSPARSSKPRDGSSVENLSMQLPPSARIQLSAFVFKIFAANEDLRGRSGWITDVVNSLLAAVRECAASDVGLRKVDLAAIESALYNLINGFGTNTSYEKIKAAIVLAVLESDTTCDIAFSPAFIVSILQSLVRSRNPQLAFSIFNAVAYDDRPLEAYDAVLRSHDPKVSDHVFKELLTHPKLVPTVDSFYSRMVSHAHHHNNNLEQMRDDLRRMQQMKIPRIVRIWNKLLQLVARVGSSQMYERQWKRTTKAKVDVDEATFMILLSRSLKTRSGIYQANALSKKFMLLEKREVSRHGKGAATPAMAENMFVKNLSRWELEVNSDGLVALAKKVLDVDLGSENQDIDWTCDGAVGDIPRDLSRKHYMEIRRPVYKMLIKQFNHRGDWIRRQRALAMMRSEEQLVRMVRSAEVAEDGDDGEE